MSFTPFQHLIAQHTLDAIADLGFALGGGQALHAHGYGDRLSLDLDFYVTRRPTITAEEFAADLAAAAEQDPEDYHAYGLTDADITRLAADFTRWAAELRTQDIDDSHR